MGANADGVYGLYVGNGPWIYVGKGNIRSRLLAHAQGDNASITREKPTFWRAEVTASMDKREKELILELNPKCNRKVG